MGLKCVVRYMDDIIILHYSSSFLHWLIHKMDEYLKVNLDLKIKDNWQVFPTGIRGVDFVGYRHFYGYKLLRKTTCKKFKAKMLAIKEKQDSGNLINYREWCAANSYIGWLSWCDSWRLFEKYVEPIIPALAEYYLNVVKAKHKKGSSGKNQILSFERYRNKIMKKKGRCAAMKKKGRCAA